MRALHRTTALVLALVLTATPARAAPQDAPRREQDAPPAGPATPDDTLQLPGPVAADARLTNFRRRSRSTTAAVLMSVPIPGWGQLYSDSPFWATLAFGLQMFYLGNVLLESRRQVRQIAARDAEAEGSSARELRSFFVAEHGERMRDYVWWSLGGALLVSLDAYVSIALSDFDDPNSPVPDLDRDWAEPAALSGPDGAGLTLGLNWRF